MTINNQKVLNEKELKEFKEWFNKKVESKTLNSNYEVKNLRLLNYLSLSRQLSYFNLLKEEGLIKHYLSFHQFKKLGLYDSLKNHRSSYPDNFVKGKNGFVLFKVNSDYSLRVMDWKDKRELTNALKRNDEKALTQYANAIKKEQLRLLSKIETQFKKGNYCTLSMINDSQFSNKELNEYVFSSVIKKYSNIVESINKEGVKIYQWVFNKDNKGLLSVFKCYKYHLNESYKDFYKSLIDKNHIHLITGLE